MPARHSFTEIVKPAGKNDGFCKIRVFGPPETKLAREMLKEVDNLNNPRSWTV